MFNKKLIALLRSFTRQELRQLEKFLASGLQICPANGASLVRLFLPYYPDFDEKMPDKNWFFEQIFPGKPYNDSKFRLLVSDTYAAVRRFAVLNLVETAPEYEAILFAHHLQTRSVNDLLEIEITRAEKVLEQRSRHNKLHHVHLWMLHHIENAMLCEQYFQNGKQKEHQPALEKAVHTLHCFYLIARLDYHLWRNEYLEDRLPEELDDTYSRISKLLPVIPDNLTVMRKLAYLSDNMTDRAVLDEMMAKFHSPEVESYGYIILRMMFSITHNCSLVMEWSGYPAYLTEKHKLFKRVGELNIVFSEPNELVSLICNAARTSSIVKDYDFFDSFYRGYEKAIPQAIRSSTFHYCYAVIENSKENYDAAFHHLQKVTYDSYRRRLYFKTFMLMLYYERADFEPLFSLSDSIRHFIKDASMLREQERLYTSRFLINLGKLVKLRLSPDEEQLEKLKIHVTSNPAGNWRWTANKIDALLAGMKKSNKAESGS